MNSEKFYRAITLIDDALIDQALNYTPEKKKTAHWKRWTALAACLTVVIGVGGSWLYFGGLGGNAGSTGAGGSGADGGSTFMSYAGPVFPLTASEHGQLLSTRRDISFDFAPWVPRWISNEEEAASRTELTEAQRQDVLNNYNEWYPEGGRYRSSGDIIVTDSYTLTNTTDEALTTTLLYPFSASLRYIDSRLPTLTVNGEQVSPTLHAGAYSGGFTGAIGSEDSGEQLNLEQLNSWEQYKSLLGSGQYRTDALTGYPDLSGTDVIVYEFRNIWADPGGKDAPNPSLRVSFRLDAEKTTVLSHGFHSGSFDPENGWMGQGFSIQEEGEPDYGEPHYLIVIGEDIRDMRTGAYVTGGWDPQDSIDSYGADIARYETDLDTILRKVTALQWEDMQEWESSMHAAGYEMYHGLFCEFLLSHGILAEDGGAERYGTGWLFELDAANVDRVFYLSYTVTVPAGESIEVTASMSKPGSYDFYCAHTENHGVNGYDMVTRLDSTLDFSSLHAVLLDHGQIEIIRQNFGFDPAVGITEVILDLQTEHYYLEVKRSSGQS